MGSGSGLISELGFGGEGTAEVAGLVLTGHFIKAVIANGMANKVMPSTGIVRSLFVFYDPGDAVT